MDIRNSSLLSLTIHRFACNDLDFTPEDIVLNLYGHSCGEYDQVCKGVYEVNTFSSYHNPGPCKHGARKAGYLLDDIFNDKKIIKSFDMFEKFVSDNL